MDASHRRRRGVVNVNLASAAELAERAGLARDWAEHVVRTRDRSGPYATVDELYSRAGLPYEMFAELRDRVVLSEYDPLPVGAGTTAPASRTGTQVLSVIGSLVLVGVVIGGQMLLRNGVDSVADWFAAPERDDAGAVTAAGTESARDLLVGDCVNLPDRVLEGKESEVEDLGVVPCAQAHDVEVYFVSELPDGSYPGDDDVAVAGDGICFEAFAGYVGRAWEESTLTYYFISPTRDTWNRLDDRKITCLLGDPSAQVTGSLEGIAV